MSDKQYTQTQRRELVAQVNALRKCGTLKEACEAAGITPNNYQWWSTQARRARRTSAPTRKPRTTEPRAPRIIAQFAVFSNGKIVNLTDLAGGV